MNKEVRLVMDDATRQLIMEAVRQHTLKVLSYGELPNADRLRDISTQLQEAERLFYDG